MNQATFFDISQDTRLRPTCLKCDLSIEVGIAYVRYPRPDAKIPVIECYHNECAPERMLKLAQKNEGKRKAGQ